MSKEKESLTFTLGSETEKDKKFTYKGFPEKRETDFFEMYYKMKEKTSKMTPEEAQRGAVFNFKKNFADLNRTEEEILDLYKKSKQKREDKARRKEAKDEPTEGRERKEKRERRSERENDGDKSDRKERRHRSRSRSSKRRSSSKDPKKERRRRSSSPEVERTPRSARKIAFSPSKEKQIKAHIDMILNGGDGDVDFGSTSQEDTTPDPPAQRLPSTVQIKLAMEGDTHKLVSVARDITFDAILDEIEKKCKKRFAISYEDEEGDRIELDDDNSLQMFFESSVGKRLKLICTEMGIDDKLTEQVTMYSSPRHTEPERPGGAGDSRAFKTLGGPQCEDRHTEAIYCCEFSQDGEKIVTASRDRTLKIWSTRSGEVLTTLKDKGHLGYVLSCDYSPCNHHVVSASEDKTCKIWMAGNGRKLANLNGHTDKVYCCKYSPDAKYIASASCDQVCRVWNTDTQQSIYSLTGHTGPVFSCTFSNNGRHIATGSDDDTVRTWDWRSLLETAVFKGHSMTVWSTNFSHDDKYLLSASMDHQIILWDIRMRKQLRVMKGHQTPIHHAVFAKNSNYIVSCARDWTVMVWDTQSGLLKNTLNGHGGTVYHTAYHDDILMSCSLDETVKLWKFPQN
eukprot:TRINITY_DN1388_c0_g4_i1.p1 TRINITY_DN1388_c0_g4~~TRINITY_DN1388_c0_g4_i1.p1  ORF type:complete len:624 (+),score=124.65 TRINITY_DN1388_c0_g4_i1:52-1923(+)